MWPLTVDWQALRFGVEIEFVEGEPGAVTLLPGWKMALDEHQVDDQGWDSGAEMQTPPLRWQEREQIREMLARLASTSAKANWSCGLHVHVGIEPWGEAIVQPLLQAALTCQTALQHLLQTAEHRLMFCPPVIPEMAHNFAIRQERDVLCHRGRPQSHRCGINTAAWYDIGTVEIRFANGTLDFDQVCATVELCLRFVAAVGAGRSLPAQADELAAALGAPSGGYPPPAPAPLWHLERMWLEEALIPAISPLVLTHVPGGEVHDIRPTAQGFQVSVEHPDNTLSRFWLHPRQTGWELTPA
jgi:hypothetical protein